MDLHVLAQRAGVRVALVTAAYLTVVWLVTRVHVGVLLAVRAVGKSSVAAIKLTLERLLSCTNKTEHNAQLKYLAKERIKEGWITIQKETKSMGSYIIIHPREKCIATLPK